MWIGRHIVAEEAMDHVISLRNANEEKELNLPLIYDNHNLIDLDSVSYL